MAEEYISRKKARDAISALAVRRFELSDAYKVYIEALKNVDDEIERIPAAHVEPVRHGHWIKVSKIPDELFECSECGISYEQKENYCPWCGARMDGEESV